MRAPALAAKAAGGKLARLGADGRSALLRALAAALREPGVRAEVAAANAADLERARPRTVRDAAGEAPRPRREKLDGVCDGLRPARRDARPGRARDAAPRAGRRAGAGARHRAAGSAGRRVRVAPGRAGADRRPRLEERQRRAAQGRARGAAARNRALAAVIHRVLEAPGIDPRAAVLLEGREDVAAVLGLHGIVELIVARGSSEFVRHVMAQRDIPVMGHAAGVCHLYVHAGADPGHGGGAGRRRQDAPTRRRATPPRRCCGTRARARRWTRASRR